QRGIGGEIVEPVRQALVFLVGGPGMAAAEQAEREDGGRQQALRSVENRLHGCASASACSVRLRSSAAFSCRSRATASRALARRDFAVASSPSAADSRASCAAASKSRRLSAACA